MKTALIRTLLKSLALLPLPLNHRLGALLGWLVWITPNRNRRITEANLRFCFPNQSPEWHQRTTRQSLIETGKNFTELGPLWLWEIDKLKQKIVQVSGQEHLDRAIREQRGVFIVSPHIGAWELVGAYAASLLPMTILFRPPRLEAFTPIMREARERTGGSAVPTDTRGVKALFQALSRAEAVGMLPDQEPKQGSGVFAPFFGKPTYTMVLLSKLAQKTRAVPVFAFMERLPNGAGYHLHWLPIGDEVYAKDQQLSASAINEVVEQCIEINPSQYMWSYKRFKQRPDGEPGIY